MTIQITNFKKYEKGSLYGFFDIAVPMWGTMLNIKGCKVFMKEGKPFITLPSREYQNDQGETKYANLIGLEDTEVFKKFMNAILDAWTEYCKTQLQPLQTQQQPQQPEEGLPF